VQEQLEVVHADHEEFLELARTSGIRPFHGYYSAVKNGSTFYVTASFKTPDQVTHVLRKPFRDENELWIFRSHGFIAVQQIVRTR